MNVFKQILLSSRPISWVNTAYPFAFSYWLITGQIDYKVILGSIFFLFPYNLLMYGINDVFDYESDLRNPRKGGVEGALLDPKYHKLTIWIAALSATPFVLWFLVIGNFQSSFWLLLSCFTVVAYSIKGLRFKEKPVLDSITSALHFVGPLLVGISLAGVNPLTPPLLQVVIAFLLWAMASHAFGAVQDIRADRAAGIASIATKISAKNTVRFAFVAYLLAVAMLLITPQPGPWASLALLPYLLIIAPYLNLKDEECEKANRGWKHFLKLNFLAGAIVTLLVL